MLPAWFWFLVAVLAAAGGAALLFVERRRTGSHSRDRQRWAEQKSWEFVDADPVLPSRWRHGSIAQGGPGRALDLATGAVPGPGGRRLAHVFDHEQAGQVTGVIAAVRGVSALPVAIEFRLPSAPLPDDAGLDSLGQVGDRYAFVTSVADARPLVTPEVARSADEVGDDVPLLWAEEAWVLASIEAGTSAQRVQELLQTLVEVSAALEEALEAADDGLDGSPGGDHGLDDDDHDDDHDLGEHELDGHDGGPDRDGTDHAGPDHAGPDHAGPDHAGPDHAGPDGWSPQRAGAPAHGAPRTGTAGIDRARQTHRDHPGEIPYDIEDDEPGASGTSGASGTRSSTSFGR